MTLEYWKEQIEKTPEIRPWLERLARYAVKGSPLPAEVTLGEVPQERRIRDVLTNLFGRTCREAQGRLKIRLDESQHDPVRWLPLATVLGIHAETSPSEAEREAHCTSVFRKLLLQYPNETSLIEAAKNDDVVQRFVRFNTEALDALFALFDAIPFLRTNCSSITLSELGARVFNDSKALRSGPFRQQLEQLLGLDSDLPEATPRDLLNLYNIIDNPYTTHVVVFAPFAYCTPEGIWLEWPAQLFQRGEAAILSWETVRTLKAVRLTSSCNRLVTSENAAPFHRMVEQKTPSLYTEGYPNLAVKTLLRHFADAGVTAQHWGDTDLDGYRIAEQIARCIAMTLYADASHAPVSFIPLDDKQRLRLESFITRNPDFPYLQQLRHTLLNGWTEQEQFL
ncbi:MAG: DUF2399 domain-containing protein [bacterium]